MADINKLLIRGSNTSGVSPSSLAEGADDDESTAGAATEIAINRADGKLFYLNDSDAVTELTPSSTKSQIDALGITTVGALASGSIAGGFGAIDNGTSNITTGGLLSLDIDSAETINTSGGGIGAAGSITIGAGSDAGMYVSSDDLYIENKTSNKDIIFRANDGGTFKTMLTLDGSASGTAYFNDSIFVGDDVRMNSDGATIKMGENEEIYLTHTHNEGLKISNENTGNTNPLILTLESEENIVTSGETLARINFKAGDENGTDAAEIAASIAAVSEAVFTAGDNSTKLTFGLGESGSAVSRTCFTMDHDGHFYLNRDSSSLKIGADNDFTITHDGTTGATIAGNPITIDSGDDLSLDANTGKILLKDGGTTFLLFEESSNTAMIQNPIDGGDIIIRQADSKTNLRISDSNFVGIGGNDAAQGILRFMEDTDNGSNYINLQAPAAISSNVDITLPTSAGTLALANADTTGNAATATALASARNIGGVSFDGTGNIDLPGVNSAGNQNTSGTAATATLASTVTVTNSTANTNFPVVFHDESNALLDDTGAFTFNPNDNLIKVGKVGRDGDNNIDFTTDNTILLKANNENQLKLEDGVFYPDDTNEIDLGKSDKEFKDAFFDGTVTTDSVSIGGHTINAIDVSSEASNANDHLMTALAIKNRIEDFGYTTDANVTHRPITAGGNSVANGETLVFTAGTGISISESGGAVTITNSVSDTTLSTENVQDIAGGMFAGNTETGITATYQDSDGTIDLEVGILNQDTTGTAATVTGAAQSNITSLGTLTTLTVDDITINGSTITDAGALDFNIGGDLTFDVDGSDILFKDDGQERFHFNLASTPTMEVTGVFDIDCSNDIILDATDDIIFKYNDGTTAITFDLSASPDMDIVGDFKIDGGGKIEIESGASKDIHLDSAGDIVLDYADGDSVIFKHGSANDMLDISGTGSGNHVTFQLLQDGGDLIFKQYNGTEVARVEDGGLFDVVSNKLAINGTAITATAAELNIMDGVTSTTAEINTLDGFDGDVEDLKYAKDLKDTGVTATEFNYLDGVTSAIQTQIDNAGGGGTGDISFSGTTASGNGITLDSAADITLDADGADVFLKDAGTTYGSLTNNSGGLIIKSGTTSVMRYDSSGSPEINYNAIKQVGAWIFGHSNLDSGYGTKISWSSTNSNQGDIFNHRALMPAKGKILSWIMKTDGGISGVGTPPMTVTLTGSSTSGQSDALHSDDAGRFTGAVSSAETLGGLIGYQWEAGDTITGEINCTAGNGQRAQSSALIEWTY